MSEADLTRRIQRHLKERGCYCVKIHGGPNQPAMLDLTGARKGRFFSIEVKLPERRNTVTKRQAHIIRQVRMAGGISDVVTSVEEAEALLWG